MHVSADFTAGDDTLALGEDVVEGVIVGDGDGVRLEWTFPGAHADPNMANLRSAEAVTLTLDVSLGRMRRAVRCEDLADGY